MQLRIEPEVGVTDNSLRNAEVFQKKFGAPFQVNLMETHDGEKVVIASYTGHTHMFTGFAWGYGGTGPHGLLTFLLCIGVNNVTMGDIVQLSSVELVNQINKTIK